jgi:threonine synthase
VFVPAYASGPKREQIAAYGAEVIPVEGPRSAAAQAVLKATAEGAVYASHAYLPFGLPGLATISYELVEQLGKAPGTVITPAGHGSLMLGMLHGFIAMQNAGVINHIPKIIGVQAAACAPIWQMATWKITDWEQADEGETLAEGVRVKSPVCGEKLVSLMDNYPIQFMAVAEEEILPGRDQLAHLGFYVETTSAIVWSAMTRVVDQLPVPVVMVLTGSGLKSYRPSPTLVGGS